MDEVKCYGFYVEPIDPLRDLKRLLEFTELIKEQEGLVGMHPDYPRGSIAIFYTKNDEKRARNVLKFHKIGVGEIGEVFIPTGDMPHDHKGLD